MTYNPTINRVRLGTISHADYIAHINKPKIAKIEAMKARHDSRDKRWQNHPLRERAEDVMKKIPSPAWGLPYTRAA